MEPLAKNAGKKLSLCTLDTGYHIRQPNDVRYMDNLKLVLATCDLDLDDIGGSGGSKRYTGSQNRQFAIL